MPPSARHVVVMGVSGSGKTTLAGALGAATGFLVADADAFHPPAAVATMSRGVPLTDEDRAPWLDNLAGWLGEQDRAGRATVLACSALRLTYRDTLRAGATRVEFVELDVDPGELVARMTRRHHFMPVSLVDSQLATLEPLGPHERGIRVDGSQALESLVAEVVRRLGLPQSSGRG